MIERHREIPCELVILKATLLAKDMELGDDLSSGKIGFEVGRPPF